MESNGNNFVEFHSKTNNNYTIKKTYNINEITNQQDNSILRVKINPHHQNEFALINSNFELNYISINQDGAFNIGSYKEHKQRVNDICFFSSKNSNFDKAFVSGGNDGVIKIWDSRSPDSAKTLKTNGIEVFCVDTSDDKLVAGFGREIGIWDLKMMKNMCRYKAGHCMDVVDIKIKGNDLLTAGEDCIINHFNIENGLNMDSLVSAINLGQPANYINFIDENRNLATVNTSVYTMEICSFEKGSSQYSYNSIDELYNTQYCLESSLVENNFDLRNSKDCGLNQNEDLYKGDNYLQLFSGNNYGDLVILDFLLNQNIDIKVNSVIKTNFAQTFNSVAKADSTNGNNTHVIGVTDLGNIYILDRKNQEEINKETFDELEIPNEEEDMKTSKGKSNKFNPY